jgi:hypothetical protein
MRCHSPRCPSPSRGLKYAADGVHICTACGEMNRNHRHVELDEFCQIDPTYQKQIGQLRQTIQENLGHWDYLKLQGVEVLRG